jgi:hypothetical protein
VIDLPLEQALAEKGIPVWRPPCRPEKLRSLLLGLEVPIVERSAAEPIAPAAAAVVRGGEFLDDFCAAVDHFNDRLVERNFDLHAQLGIDWPELRGAEVAVDAELQQRVALPGRKPLTVPSEGYFLREPLTLCVQSGEALGMADAAGNAVAALFESADGESRDYLALAWDKAWSAALSGERAVGIKVAAAEEDGDPLADWQNDPRRPVKRGKMERNSLNAKANGKGPKAADVKIEPRKLATLEDILARLPDGQYSNGSGSSNRSKDKPARKRKPLKLRKPVKNGGSAISGPPRTDKEYDNNDVEARGLEVLEDRMWEWFGLELSDQHLFSLVGSDAVDEFAGFWVELKAHAGEVQDGETLTASEAKRALEEGRRYLLAVVSGLEEGATPDVRIFADPIHTLDPRIDRSIRLSGVKSSTGLKKIDVPKAAVAGNGGRKA